MQYINKLIIIAILVFSKKLWKKYTKENITKPKSNKKKNKYISSIYVNTFLIINVLQIAYIILIIKYIKKYEKK